MSHRRFTINISPCDRTCDQSGDNTWKNVIQALQRVFDKSLRNFPIYKKYMGIL